MYKILRVRLKDKHARHLRKLAYEINFIWNYLNALSNHFIREKGQWLSAYDMAYYTKGASQYLNVNSQTIQAVAEEYVARRNQTKKAKLRWRKSLGTHRSLGWIPVKGQTIRYQHGQIVYNKHFFKLWDSYRLGQYTFKQGSFSEDSRGRWYFNIAVRVEPKEEKSKATKVIGIDLGLKDTATYSNGIKLEAARHYRSMEKQLATAQRAHKKQRVKAIHSKIKNKRRDDLHKFSKAIADSNALVVVGNVSSSKLAKTRMAKSVYDSGWHMLKTMLDYKCAHAGNVFVEVNERYTTQICSNCGERPDSRPKGIADLGMRLWTCDACGEHHDRDINAAKNIAALGLERLGGGIPTNQNDWWGRKSKFN